MLLVLALRTGAVAFTSIQSLVSETSKSLDRCVPWLYPERAVFASFNERNGLDLDKPARSVQLVNTVKEAALTYGLREDLNPHDFRRGAVKDLHALNKALPTQDVSFSIASSVGHSRRAFNQGVTDQYNEPVTEDLWSQRVEAPPKRSRFDIAPTVQPTSKKRLRLTPQEISDAMPVSDVKDRNARVLVGRRLRKEKLKQREPLGSLSSNIQLDTLPDAIPDANEGDMVREQTLTETDPSGTGSLDIDIAPTHDIPIDPAILDDTVNLISGQASRSIEPDLMEIMLESASAAISSSLDMSRTAFINRYASINIVRNERQACKDPTAARLAKDVYYGGSKESPTFFAIECPNRHKGCLYTATLPRLIKIHLVACDDPKNTPRSLVEKTHVCEHCGNRQKTIYLLRRHIKDYHEWIPSPCKEPGPNCDDRIFQTGSAYKVHWASHHPTPAALAALANYQPQRCLVPDCESETIFPSLKSYRAHLRVTHMFATQVAKLHLPESFKPRQKSDGPRKRTQKKNATQS
ncbi:MAG: hypothetical protein Q9195_008304 [Heterodermia aff. obscurata]